MQRAEPNRSGQIADISARHGLDLVVLYGSAAEGKVRPESDVDLAVLPGREDRHGSRISKLDLIFDFSGVLEPRVVDLCVLTPDTDPLLAFEIFRKGRPLFEARPGLFEEQRRRAAFLYWDTERFRRLEAEFVRSLEKR